MQLHDRRHSSPGGPRISLLPARRCNKPRSVALRSQFVGAPTIGDPGIAVRPVVAARPRPERRGPIFPLRRGRRGAMGRPMLNIDLSGKRAFVAGVADDGGFGFAIAKALAEAGASVCVGTWP